MNIEYIHEPTDLQCGQAVLAMLLGTTAEYICGYLGNERETDLREMKRVLTEHGVKFSPERTGRCMRTALSTIRSMACSGIFRSRSGNITGRYFPKLSQYYIL